MAEEKKPLTEEEQQMRKTTRTAFIRIFLCNHIHEDNEKRGVKKGDTVTYTVEDIKKKLDDWSLTKKISYYMILHDGENPHVHIVIEFPKNSPCTFGTIKNKFPWGKIETCGNVRACVRYLPHIDQPDKKQYDWSEVITNNPERLEVRYKPDEDMYNIDVVTDKILNGELKPFMLNKIPHEVYSDNYVAIKRAFEYREQTMLTNPNRNIEVYVLQGSPRVGKTTYCKIFAKKNGKSICFSSSSRDPWQDYNGQDLFIFDDADHSKIDIEDFKKTLDPYTNTTMSRRYRNTLFTGDTIFICTNTPITEWFPYDDDKSREAVFKRITYVLDFKSYEELSDISDLSLLDLSKIPKYSEGTSYYTVNRLVSTDDFKEVHDKLGLVANRYRVWDLQPIDDKLHEFDLKKYIDVTDSEKKREDFRKIIEDI